jgi:hypothetical protein
MAALAPKLNYVELDDIPGQVNIDIDESPPYHLDLGKELSQASQLAAVVNQLREMGFSDEQTTVAAFYGKTLNGALEFLTADRTAKAHLFIPGDMNEICAICFQFESDHTAKMSFKPEKKEEYKEPSK